MLLYYIRHGDPIYDPDSLTPLGKRQAEAVGRRIAVYGIDKIFASTSNRAYETAVPLSEISKKDIEQFDFLSEHNAWIRFTVSDKNGHRDWVYKSPELRKLFVSEEVRKLGDRWYEHPDFAEYSFKEGVEFFGKNFDEFFLFLGYKHDRVSHTYKAIRENNERVAVFAHEGIGSIFLSSVLDIPYSQVAAHYAMSHTGVTVIKFESNGDAIVPQLLQLSNDSHLYKEGLPTRYWGIEPV